MGDGAIDGLSLGVSDVGIAVGDVVGAMFGLGVVGFLVGRGVVGWSVGRIVGLSVGWEVAIALGSGVVEAGHPQRFRTLSQRSSDHPFSEQYSTGPPSQNSALVVRRGQGHFLTSHALWRYTLLLRHWSGSLALMQAFLGLSQKFWHFL